MKNNKEMKVPVALERLQVKFEEWRKQRRGRERIPKELWTEAERIARSHGVNLVSRVLSLSYTDLKRRLGKGAINAGGKPSSEAVFVEMERGAPEKNSTCVIELEKANGIRMQIRVDDAASVDWSRIKEAFLGA